MTQTITETYVRDVNGHHRNAEVEEEEEDDSVEIQRNFAVPPDCDSRLKPYGARLLADQVFNDEFYDTPDYALLLQGITLRMREGELELWQVSSRGEDVRGASRLLRNRDEISSFLRSRSLLRDAELNGNLNEALKSGGLDVFAAPCVSRKVYGIPAADGLLPAKISFDLSDLGHSVGEIEISVDHRDELPAAVKTIEVLSQRLGFKSVAELG